MTKINGFLGYYRLADWWLSTFTQSDREYIEQVYQPLGLEPGSRSLTQGAITRTTATKTQVLHGLAGFFGKSSDRHLARKILAKAEETGLAESDVMGLHFTYNQMVKTYYKDRAEPEMLEAAIEACEKQIALAPQAAQLFRKEWEDLAKHADFKIRPFQLPSHTGFEQLAIILEKQKEYAKAIALCERAAEQGWAGDWPGRIERCQKKVNKLKTES